MRLAGSVAGLASAAFFLACAAPSLDVPENVTVTCVADAECPAQLPVCADAGICISRDFAASEGPRLVAVTPASPSTVILAFDLALLESSVTDDRSYLIDGLEVLSAALRADGASVLLETTPQVPAVAYTLSALGVRDRAGRAPLEASGSFRGFGVSPDELPPDLVSPPDDASFASLTVSLAWSGRAVATRYLVEVATDPTFASLATDPVEVAAPRTQVEINLAADGTYYWRVRSDIQAAASASPVRRFHLFEDTIFVACPDGVAACAGGFGTRQLPLQRINDALDLSDQLGVAAIAIAGRSTPYLESLVIRGSHRLGCGLDPTFATRDPLIYPTTIESVEAVGALFAIDASDLAIDGCAFTDAQGAAAVSIIGSERVTITRATIDAAALDDVTVVSVLDASVELESSTLRLLEVPVIPPQRGAPNETALARVVRGTLGVATSTLVGARAVSPRGISVVAGGLRLTDSRLELGDASSLVAGTSGVGVHGERCTVEVHNSQLATGIDFNTSYVVDDMDCDLTLDGSVLVARNVAGGSNAVRHSGAGVVAVVNSVLVGALAAGKGSALDVNLVDGTVDVFNSTLFSSPGGAESLANPAVVVRMDAGVVTSCAPYTVRIVNNVLVGTGTSIGNTLVIGPGDTDPTRSGTVLLHNALMSPSTGNALAVADLGATSPASVGCAGDSVGNVFIAREASTFFTNFGGPDGDPRTLADNVYSPTAAVDRAALRMGIDTQGTCATSPCRRVPVDIAAATRVSAPVSVGAYDLP